ncbi:hypothetical protein CS0771_03440 [Catellatospora sp. IY07-71]|uniref:hypothetical protein n=1 Tax=Catellatospora sp. IY07-71 TaxID=2728827 RepID=UPI001BB302D8|nr:hypothetical protein [Catellatospora sp. IY07-71]BCJ70800.1 hypothetical protein CS0771_03440 [Catellatospora sp. IY07-71]
MSDLVVRFGPVDTSLSPAQVMTALEQSIEIWFLEGAGGQRTSTEEFARLVLTVDHEARSPLDRACPYVLDVYPEGVHDDTVPGISALGVVFARVASSGQFHAVMLRGGRELALTPGLRLD